MGSRAVSQEEWVGMAGGWKTANRLGGAGREGGTQKPAERSSGAGWSLWKSAVA